MNSYASLAQATPDEVEPAHLTPAKNEDSGVAVPALAGLRAEACCPEEWAQRELQASLRLLAERMQHITGASAAAIALNEGNEMRCRASAGPMATELGASLRADPALIAECMRQQQIICCNAAENGTAADGTSYGNLGIKSVMVMPLVREAEVVGMLELLADRPQAFDDRDGAALQRLSEMVLTAVEHNDAARKVLTNPSNEDHSSSEKPTIPVEGGPGTEAQAVPSPVAKQVDQVNRCEACGFPVSEGRTLCVDCENARAAEDNTETAPAFLTQLVREQEQSWLESHFYTIGTVLMVALTVVALMLKLR
jgi:hypothetical protein